MRERNTPITCLFKVLLGLGMVALVGGGCTDEVTGETPPDSGFYFPMNMTSSNSRFVYVLNSNFDQRYNSGWVSVLDLAGEGGDGGKLYSKDELPVSLAISDVPSHVTTRSYSISLN